MDRLHSEQMPYACSQGLSACPLPFAPPLRGLSPVLGTGVGAMQEG